MSNIICTVGVFSPTGATERVADAVAKSIDDHYKKIDLSQETDKQEITDDQLFVTAVPVYGGRVPEIARKRLSRIRGCDGNAVAIVVYGNRAYDHALLELKDVLEASGFVVRAAAAFIGEHSMVRDIGKGRPDADDLKKAEQFGQDVLDKIQTTPMDKENISVPGNPAYHTKKAEKGCAPETNKNCVKCGKCVSLCPVGAISKAHPAQTDKTICVGCMRCVSVCPKKARKLPGVMAVAAKVLLTLSASKKKQPEIFI